jgi:hypothetical protein
VGLAENTGYRLIVAPGIVERPEVAEVRGDIRVIRANRLLANRKRALKKRLCLRIVTLRFVQQPEVVEWQSDIRVIRTQHLLNNSERALGKRYRLVVLPRAE